jgi:tetratricopeptide (TPR) repeat protein
VIVPERVRWAFGKERLPSAISGGTIRSNQQMIAKGTSGAAKLLLLLFAVAVTEATAQSAEQPVSQAQELALESLEYLRRGEEATDPDLKIQAYRRGVEIAKQAIRADDLNADAHFALFANQGRVLMLEGVAANPMTLMEANRELNRTLELNPNHADALAAKGGMYRQLPWALGGSNKKASEYLARSVELDYDNACAARIELAELYRDLGYPERSIPLLEKAVEIAMRDNKPDRLLRAQKLLRELGAR